MPLSAASINRASYQVLLLLAAAAVSTTGGDGNTAPGNATATATTRRCTSATSAPGATRS